MRVKVCYHIHRSSTMEENIMRIIKMVWVWLIVTILTFCLVVGGFAEDEIQIPEVSATQFDIPNNEAMAFLKDLGVGWILGNTFDAYVDGASWFRGSETDIETAWVGVKTSRELIATVHAAGYSTIRIPVSWHEHVDEDFTISEAWLSRVQEVVDYAIDEGMYVILNTHHDVYPQYYYPLNEHYETSERYITCIWSQLSERFADYDEHLIFESMNEPRLRETDVEWTFNAQDARCVEAADCINCLNQAFVNTVRAAGGFNATRYLMVPGYAAAPENALNSYFVLPQDTADNRVIVSVHAYTPYTFALQDGGQTSFAAVASSQTSEIARFMNALYETYISQGIPVIIGEFGARDKGENYQDRVNYAAYYTAFASARNLPCLWWDNNAYTGSGENFGLIPRDTCTWRYPKIPEAMMKYAGYDNIPAKVE